MAEQVETAVDLQQKAVDLIDQMTNGLKAIAPQLTDVTLAAVQLQGWVSLAQCVVQTLAVTALLAVGYRFITRVAWNENGLYQSERKDDLSARGAISLVVGIPSALAGTIMGTVTFFDWLDASMWAALIDPRAALALRVIDKIM